MKRSRAKISKINLGEGIDKCAILVHDDTLKKWIPCGTIDEKGLEK